VVLVLLFKEGVDRTQRGTGAGTIEAPAGERVVSVARAAANDYDPLGDDEEHREQTSRTVDRDEGTAWTTEQYPAGLEGAGKAGVGVYIDAKPRVEAVEMQIVTPEPGWRATIYAAPPGDVPKSIENGWKKVGGGTVSNDEKRFKLDTGGEQFRYYLVWITKLGPDAERAEISEIRLLQEVAA
jgi:serine/threonine-protein kinase